MGASPARVIGPSLVAQLRQSFDRLGDLSILDDLG